MQLLQFILQIKTISLQIKCKITFKFFSNTRNDCFINHIFIIIYDNKEQLIFLQDDALFQGIFCAKKYQFC